jgi:N-acetylated-alpha-linked acidic dipeptidase
MKLFSSVLLCSATLLVLLSSSVSGHAPDSASGAIFGFRDAAAENATEARFLAVPDPKLAEEHLRTLTQAPHMAGTPEDEATAKYVAQKFRDAGLDTEIVEYKVWINYPLEISVDITAPEGVEMHGPTREHVDGDAYDEDPRVVMPFNGMSPSGDAEAEVVYANYGTPEDFEKLEKLKIDVRGKIVLVRYGQNFRGVKEFIAQEHGAAGVIIYSDPYDDGWRRGDKYPAGPWRPDTGVQRGSVGYMFEFPGDPTTPGIASLPSLPESKRISPDKSAQMPKIPITPLSYHDAWPILQHLAGPDSPREWQGALPFTYHVGPGPVRVKMHLKQDYQFRTLWDVIGRVRGADSPGEWVVAGNHRDAWVYGAVDPNSGTAAMLEAVHGVGELLKSGWKPKRTMIFASWDGEEEGLMGSTEWAEQYESELANAPAYFNMDVAVSGPKFGASAVPSLKQFIRDVTKAVPSPKGGTVYEAWQKGDQPGAPSTQSPNEAIGDGRRMPAVTVKGDVPVGDLGSGSDYSVFQQHLGVPSSDMSSLCVRQFCLVQEIWGPGFHLRTGDGENLRTGGAAYRRRRRAAIRLRRVWQRGGRVPGCRGKTSGEQIWQSCSRFQCCDLGREALSGCGDQDSCEAEESSARFGALEPGAARRRARSAGSGGTAAPSLVSPCNLRSRGIHGIRRGGDSGSE